MTLDAFLQRLGGDSRMQNRAYRQYSKYLQEKRLEPFQVELIRLQEYLEKKNEKMIVLIEGRDAAGKGGAIRKMTRYMNEKHYRVVALGKPSDVQQTQWYFQRYVEQFPHGGEILFFDRSWYNRAMVEPVFGFCTEQQYEVFMRSVTSFEKDLIDHGIHFVKIYFSVTKEEQARRFRERENNPLKQWKLSEIDLQMQERWDDFTQMKYEMLKRTHTKEALWTVIRSDERCSARLNAINTILNSVDYDGRNPELDYDLDPKIAHSGADEIHIMEEDLRARGKFLG